MNETRNMKAAPNTSTPSFDLDAELCRPGDWDYLTDMDATFDLMDEDTLGCPDALDSDYLDALGNEVETDQDLPAPRPLAPTTSPRAYGVASLCPTVRLNGRDLEMGLMILQEDPFQDQPTASPHDLQEIYQHASLVRLTLIIARIIPCLESAYYQADLGQDLRDRTARFEAKHAPAEYETGYLDLIPRASECIGHTHRAIVPSHCVSQSLSYKGCML